MKEIRRIEMDNCQLSPAWDIWIKWFAWIQLDSLIQVWSRHPGYSIINVQHDSCIDILVIVIDLLVWLEMLTVMVG